MKKYFNSENATFVVLVVIGAWIAMATYDAVAGKIRAAKAKLSS